MDFWLPLLDGAYEVSELGDVRRVAGGRGAAPGRILHQFNKDGYRVVSLSVSGLPRRYYVHRLVAAAFIGPCPDGYIVNHVDGVRSNCKASNLEYITPQENSVHAGRTGALQQGERHSATRLTNQDVRDIRAAFTSGTPQHVLAAKYRIAASTLHSIVHGRTWKGV